MRTGFFRDAFALNGIESVVPRGEEQEIIASRIETELEYGMLLAQTQRCFCEIIERMIREDSIEAVVLGCTELPMLLKGTDFSVPYVDVMQVHIDTLIGVITGKTMFA